MRLTLHDDSELRIYLDRERRPPSHQWAFVVTIEGTKSTRDVHVAYGLAERALKGTGIKVSRVDVKLDQAGAKAVRAALEKRGQAQGAP